VGNATQGWVPVPIGSVSSGTNIAIFSAKNGRILGKINNTAIVTNTGLVAGIDAPNFALCVGGSANYGNYLNGGVALAVVWTRALSELEIKSLAANPWQIFRKRKISIGVTVTVQIARPIADISNTGWVPSAGTDLHPMIGETVRDDATYIAASVVGALCEVDLSDLGDPNVSTGHLPTLVLSAPGGGGITVRLRQGTTTIATWTYHPGTTPTEYTPTLSGAEADSITDYTALRLQFEAIA
jgi:hypothetical protein